MNGFGSHQLAAISRTNAALEGNADWSSRVDFAIQLIEEVGMDFGKGALLWLIGIPLPIILDYT
jgi:hypothetical protein